MGRSPDMDAALNSVLFAGLVLGIMGMAYAIRWP
jgi:hypothetical protein